MLAASPNQDPGKDPDKTQGNRPGEHSIEGEKEWAWLDARGVVNQGQSSLAGKTLDGKGPKGR
jgi:hypothetical protein